MKKILGLDLGTNSIGWSLVEQDFDKKEGAILGLGSRIIPMSQEILGEFEKGNSVSQTANRTSARSTRRLRERFLLRRERLHRVLNILGFLPSHYADEIDFSAKFGKFKNDSEPKLAYCNKEFIFKDSFFEMLEDFKLNQPKLVSNGKLIPYDWTIYYLRKKALYKPISREELAWLILNFNQKRGYYQLRGEEEEDENIGKAVEFYSLKIIDVIADPTMNKKGETWYSLHLENGWIYRRSSKKPIFDWKNKTRDFIVTTELNADGSIKLDKDGDEKRSFRAPKDDDWTLLKKKTEQQIQTTEKTVGTYIYDSILQNPSQKIKGKLVRTIERKFYREELTMILRKQIELQPVLFSEQKLNACISDLYKQNEAHQNFLMCQDFVHLIVNDIVFYQRPLKSQKSSIAECSLEFRNYKIVDKNGNLIKKQQNLKCIPKSHPLYQEFRLWQWISNLRVYLKEDDSNVTDVFIKNDSDIEILFDNLIERKEIKQEALIKILLEKSGLKGKALSMEVAKYRWNYVEDKSYPCNETRFLIKSRLAKVNNFSTDLYNYDFERQLWHLVYSVNDKFEFEKALRKFADKNNLDLESFEDNFKKLAPFKSEYGAYSEKAIRKLLPLMRTGSYWSWDKIDNSIKDRIEKLLSGEFDESIKNRVREKAVYLNSKTDFKGLPLWLAQYIAYDRHSEVSNVQHWSSVSSIDKYLKEFKQHSLKNPIVEQIITETLRVVRDVWIKYGRGEENFFDEIHVELGRDMKNTKDERKRVTGVVTENEKTNTRIMNFLIELQNDGNIEGVRPHSPSQQEALKIFEDGVLNSGIEIPEDIEKISKIDTPSKAEFQRYKLWMEQKYRSPYTGQIIPLNRLFSSDYEIEHIIPQSRFFDDSFKNKVICESAVNKIKDRQLGFEFIKSNEGRIVETGFGKSVKVFSVEEYENFVKKHYANNRLKRNQLLLEDIPEKMIERQINDTRYISKFVSQLLSNIVRSGTNDDGVNSKNLVVCNGKITSKLKQDWGLNDLWSELILERFERMNQLTKSSEFTTKNTSGKIIPTVPLYLSKGFNKKRIDHRHHALDALIVACVTRDHVNLLNNQSAKSETRRFDLQYKLRKSEKWNHGDKSGTKFTSFISPWHGFTNEAKEKMQKVVSSFKQNIRVINKTSNKYEKYADINGINKKIIVRQEKGDSWAIRKSMHKATFFGKVDLPRIKLEKGKILTATRKSLDTSFNLKSIESITDTGIQKILFNYLKYKNNDPDLAFSPEGIDEMNENIEQFNEGKKHAPIFKVRVFEKGSKFQVGQKGSKTSKYVEADKGTNLFFAIYLDENGKRSFATVPLNEVIERQKNGMCSVPDVNEKGHKLQFYLSPNDLVYVPDENEVIDLDNLKLSKIYKMVSSSGRECYFIHVNISSLIKSYDAQTKIGELESKNKLEVTMDGVIRIKEVCLKLQVSRLGEILSVSE